MKDAIEITTFRPEFEKDFVRLNTDWIKQFFSVEPHDVEAFSDVRKNILAGNGEIFFAVCGGNVEGCCALVHHGDDNPLGEWELAKMAVDRRARGKGIGNRLMEALLAEARRRGIEKIYLEGNTRLEASIAMYRKFGFREVPVVHRSYARVNIVMEWSARQ